MYDTHNLAELIKLTAKNRGVTIKEVLSGCNISGNTMSTLYHGKAISFDSLARIADYLDCSVDYLLGRTDNPNAHKKERPVRKDDLRDVQTTTYEQLVLAAYRAKPEMQTAVNTLLGIAAQPTIGDDMAHTIAAGEAVYGKTRTTDAK